VAFVVTSIKPFVAYLVRQSGCLLVWFSLLHTLSEI